VIYFVGANRRKRRKLCLKGKQERKKRYSDREE
jgi:hypothetical protein